MQGEYVKQKEVAEFLERLDRIHDWLYGEGKDRKKDEYSQLFSTIKEKGDLLLLRKKQFNEAATAIVYLRFCLYFLKEKKGLYSKCKETDTWLKDLCKNASPTNTPTILTAEKINEKRFELCAFATKVLHNPDKVETECGSHRGFSEVKRQLDSYCYDMLYYLTIPSKECSLANFGKEEEVTNFLKELGTVCIWLYTDSKERRTKEDYTRALIKLRKTGDVFLRRKQQHEDRVLSLSTIQSCLVFWKYTAALDNVDEKYSHIGQDQRKEVLEKCAEIDSWLQDCSAKQEKLPLYSDPILTGDMIAEQCAELQKLADQIMNKPKPDKKKHSKKKVIPVYGEPTEDIQTRNQIIDYCSTTIEKLSDPSSGFSQTKEVIDFLGKLKYYSDLVCGEGKDTTTDYAMLLEHLKTVGDKFLHEKELFDLESWLSEWKQLACSPEERYRHISKEERNMIQHECDKYLQWIANDRRNPNSPILTSAMIQGIQCWMARFVGDIMNMPDFLRLKDEEQQSPMSY